MKRPDDVELARGYTAARNGALETAKNKRQIATPISRRFTERYLAPTLSKRNLKHGFASMRSAALCSKRSNRFVKDGRRPPVQRQSIHSPVSSRGCPTHVRPGNPRQNGNLVMQAFRPAYHGRPKGLHYYDNEFLRGLGDLGV